MREALVKAAVFWLQSLKRAAGRAGSKIGPRCGPRYGAASFCGTKKTGCRKAQSEGYGSVLEHARSTPLRVASPESSAALGQRFRWTAAAEALRVATGKAPGAWLRFASLCAAQDSGPLVGRPAQRSVNVQLGRSSQSGIVALVVILVVIRYSSREFGSIKRFSVGNLRVLQDKKGVFLSSQSQVHEYLWNND